MSDDGSPINPMFDGELMFPSEYLKNEDLKGRDVTLQITDVTHEELQLRGGAKKLSFVLHFKPKTNKKVVLNVTNSRTIAKLYGKEARGWIGQPITLYPTTCRLGKDPKCPCIRVRPYKPRSKRAREEPEETVEDYVEHPPRVDTHDATHGEVSPEHEPSDEQLGL